MDRERMVGIIVVMFCVVASLASVGKVTEDGDLTFYRADSYSLNGDVVWLEDDEIAVIRSDQVVVFDGERWRAFEMDYFDPMMSSRMVRRAPDGEVWLRSFYNDYLGLIDRDGYRRVEWNTTLVSVSYTHLRAHET